MLEEGSPSFGVALSGAPLSLPIGTDSEAARRGRDTALSEVDVSYFIRADVRIVWSKAGMSESLFV